jgi:hypothetical protein
MPVRSSRYLLYRQSLCLDGPVERRRLDEGVLKLAVGTERWGDEEVITQTELEAEGTDSFGTFPVQIRHDDKQIEIRFGMPRSTGFGAKEANVPDAILLRQEAFSSATAARSMWESFSTG